MDKKPHFIKITAPDGRVNVVPYSEQTEAYYKKMNLQAKDEARRYQIVAASDEEIAKFHPQAAKRAAALQDAAETAKKLAAADTALAEEKTAHVETAEKLAAAEKMVAELQKKLDKAASKKEQ